MHTHFLHPPPLFSLRRGRSLQFFISSDFPSSFSNPLTFHLLFVIPASGHSLTAMMTSFSVSGEVSLLASLNGSLWWPRYDSQSLQCAVCEAVFNMIIRLTSLQVVDWMSASALSGFLHFLPFMPSYHSHSHSKPVWILPCLICFYFVFSSPFLSLDVFNTSIIQTRL